MKQSKKCRWATGIHNFTLIGIFLAVMFLFTIVSRKISWQMQPVVQCVTPQPMEIVETGIRMAFIEDGVIKLPSTAIYGDMFLQGRRLNAEAFLSDGTVQELTWEEIPFEGQEQDWILIPEGDPKKYEGNACTLKITSTGKTFLRVLPVECVKNENGNDFIYTLEESRSIFQAYLIRKVFVEVQYSDEHWVAVTDSLDPETLVIRTSNRTLVEGKPAHPEGEKPNGW